MRHIRCTVGSALALAALVCLPPRVVGAGEPRNVRPGTSKPGTAAPGTAAPGTAAPGTAEPGTAEPEVEAYAALKQQLARDSVELRRRFWSERRTARQRYAELERQLLRRVDRLFATWLGSRWGLGAPQSTVPKVGKTNCGLFVGVILRDVGFRLPIWKFNRQAAYHGIKSLAPDRTIRYLQRRSIKQFMAAVRKLGPGLYVIGLDFHTGFLRVHEDGRVRFVHASYVTKKVEDEPAETAIPIVTARYRMVGKILQPNMLRRWLKRRPIKVLGNR